MIRLSTKSEYGLLILEYLKRQKGYIPLGKISSDLGIPLRFSARIASDLAGAGLIESKEGKGGGYRLSSRVKGISLLDFLKIFEKFSLVKCFDPEFDCIYKSKCRHKKTFFYIQKAVFDSLKKYKLESII